MARLAILFVFLATVALSVASTNTTSPDAWVMFKQCAAPWSNQNLGTCSQTICQAGCAMSSVAMYLATRGWSGNPQTLNEWLKVNGGYESGCDIIWGTVDKLGYSAFQAMEKASYATICAGAAAGHGIIINVRDGSHWVLVTGCPAGSASVLNVNDPGFNQATYDYSDIVNSEAVYHQ